MKRITLIAFLIGVVSSFVGGTLGTIAASPFTAERTEVVFVYGTLTNPLTRAYACRCLTELSPATLRGYTKTIRNIIPAPSGQVRGGVIVVSRDELARLDAYENLGEYYARERVLVNGQPMWTYRKLDPSAGQP